MPYESRDRILANHHVESRVHRTASLVHHWSSNLKCSKTLLRRFQDCDAVFKSAAGSETMVTGYDSRWLQPIKDILPPHWSALQSYLSKCQPRTHKYSIMLFLCTLACSKHADEELIHTFLAFATVPELTHLNAPSHSAFHLSFGFEPQSARLRELIERSAIRFEDSPDSALPQRAGEISANAKARRMASYSSSLKRHVSAFVTGVQEQWPTDSLLIPNLPGAGAYINISKAFDRVKRRFSCWHANRDFKIYVSTAQKTLDQYTEPTLMPMDLYAMKNPNWSFDDQPTFIRFSTLFERSRADINITLPSLGLHTMTQEVDKLGLHGSLEAMLASLDGQSSSHFECKYVADLRKSFLALQTKAETFISLADDVAGNLKEYATKCEETVALLHQSITTSLFRPLSIAESLAVETTTCPRTCTIALLSLLSHTTFPTLGGDWKEALVTYGISISHAQQARRMMACKDNIPELRQEIENRGHDGWRPIEQPDWLLMELENDFTMRKAQAQVAFEMMKPHSAKNSVLQLNMGEGKSSVILPSVVAALADGKRLVRVITLKELSRQSFHVLLTKLGGLLNRRIFQMPFSRSLRLTPADALEIRSRYSSCMSNNGVVLTQPEHISSFELMGLETLIAGETPLATELLETQKWLDLNSRDVLDESDELLSPSYELVYTVGTQTAIDFSPDRWILIQQVLDLVARMAEIESQSGSSGLEMRSINPAGFPQLRFSDVELGNSVMRKIAKHICDHGLSKLPFHTFSKATRESLYRYITRQKAAPSDLACLQGTVCSTEFFSNCALLLRGLIAGGILLFAFHRKRFRVDYGLAPLRTALAVPYRAKDHPAPRAEFSHPDVTIVLTCLSYYYTGLSDEQLRANFEALFRSDDRENEYSRWRSNILDIPEGSHKLSGVNLHDSARITQVLFPLLRHSKAAIDFYLTHRVFPSGMKAFPQKLSSSGWNLAKSKLHPTTGFSGTNDSRYLLPLSISQNDLHDHVHTNATVLARVLQAQNAFLGIDLSVGPHDTAAMNLLHSVVHMSPQVRVVVDVGAQILELQNQEVASEWLSLTDSSAIQAAVFFNEDNELMVIDRGGSLEHLYTSSYAQRLEECVIYLDEAHTRGVDLRLPPDFRAAVTLSPELPKDRLMQGQYLEKRIFF